MPSHRLTLESSPRSGPWLLDWDATTLSVTTPDGHRLFEFPTTGAHRIIDIHTLDTEGKLTLSTAAGPLRFKRNKAAARDLRTLILAGLRTDPQFRTAQKRQARAMIQIGLAAFVLGAGPFALYCWYASRAPDPPPGHWIRSLGWLIHLVLLLLLAMAVAGPSIVYVSLRQLRRVHRAEQALLEPPPA